jgi:hypothetical protein
MAETQTVAKAHVALRKGIKLVPAQTYGRLWETIHPPQDEGNKCIFRACAVGSAFVGMVGSTNFSEVIAKSDRGPDEDMEVLLFREYLNHHRVPEAPYSEIMRAARDRLAEISKPESMTEWNLCRGKVHRFETGRVLSTCIVVMNDVLRWDRERIAEFLEAHNL